MKTIKKIFVLLSSVLIFFACEKGGSTPAKEEPAKKKYAEVIGKFKLSDLVFYNNCGVDKIGTMQLYKGTVNSGLTLIHSGEADITLDFEEEFGFYDLVDVAGYYTIKLLYKKTGESSYREKTNPFEVLQSDIDNERRVGDTITVYSSEFCY